MQKYDTEFVPEESTVFVRGVSFRQVELKKLGAGKHIFALVAEPTNKADKHAVRVMGMKGGALIHVGYLPGGDKATEALQGLSLAMAARGKLPVVNGVVKKGDAGLIVDIRTPYMRTTNTLRASLG
ncbi:hypothetical protein E3O44_04655 [Cryobacterium algoricola]|uniref:HIRAN domain-containing protein n=1 Tax=Cryobacterium algoricola TaxID=1259183 RepID=A0ABY2IKM8_9MICO|nr:HIRAN domain-containing protein [Cryobacterium algoricola]TFB90853.1 hypothetical protein E3O44_04655 [Cryobacterium algoricola]